MSRLKVVAHSKSGQIIKGFAELAVAVNEHGMPQSAYLSLPKSLAIVSAINGREVRVLTDRLKALFLVKSFEGDATYSETKFFNPAPKIEGLWVHLTFRDQETMEGIVANDMALV